MSKPFDIRCGGWRDLVGDAALLDFCIDGSLTVTADIAETAGRYEHLFDMHGNPTDDPDDCYIHVFVDVLEPASC